MDAHPSRYSATVRVQQHRQVKDWGRAGRGGEGRGGGQWEEGRGGEERGGEGDNGRRGREGRRREGWVDALMACVRSIQDRAKSYLQLMIFIAPTGDHC